MVEEKTRGEQLLGQVKGEDPSSKGGGWFKEKFTQMFQDLLGLFASPSAKSSLKPAVEAKQSSVSAAFGSQGLNLKLVNRVLGFTSVILVIITVYVAFRPRPDVSSVAAAVSKIKFQKIEDKAIKTFKDIEFYLQQMKERDIFSEFEEEKPPVEVVKKSPPPPEPPPPPPPKISIQEKAKDLKLMGISWGGKPKVIIKNEATQGVYFLREGEKIKGTEISVKEILRNKVVISSEEDEMTML